MLIGGFKAQRSLTIKNDVTAKRSAPQNTPSCMAPVSSVRNRRLRPLSLAKTGLTRSRSVEPEGALQTSFSK